MEKFSNNNESSLDKDPGKQIGDEGLEEKQEDKFNSIFKELSPEDQKIVSEEVKVLRASIMGLKNQISGFRLIDDVSDEMKEFFKSRGGVPYSMKGIYGEQSELDAMLDELNSNNKDLENIKTSLFRKDMESILSNIEKRKKFDDKKYGAYSISGEEYHKSENDFNRQLQKEREEEAIKKLRDGIRDMPMN